MFDIAGVMEEYIDNTYAYEGVGKAVGGAINGVIGGILKAIRAIINFVGGLIRKILKMPPKSISDFKEKEKKMKPDEKSLYTKGNIEAYKLVNKLGSVIYDSISIANYFYNNKDTLATEDFGNLNNIRIDIQDKNNEIEDVIKKFDQDGLKVSPEFAKKAVGTLQKIETDSKKCERVMNVILNNTNIKYSKSFTEYMKLLSHSYSQNSKFIAKFGTILDASMNLAQSEASDAGYTALKDYAKKEKRE